METAGIYREQKGMSLGKYYIMYIIYLFNFILEINCVINKLLTPFT